MHSSRHTPCAVKTSTGDGTRSVPTTMHRFILICEQMCQNSIKLNIPDFQDKFLTVKWYWIDIYFNISVLDLKSSSLQYNSVEEMSILKLLFFKCVTKYTASKSSNIDVIPINIKTCSGIWDFWSNFFPCAQFFI